MGRGVHKGARLTDQALDSGWQVLLGFIARDLDFFFESVCVWLWDIALSGNVR